MTNYKLVIYIFFGLLLNACTKSGSVIITGKWNVITDSTIITGPSVSYDIYKGKSGDYFHFNPNGILYTKEASLYDTVAYKLVSDNTIILTGIGFSTNGLTGPSFISISRNHLKIIANTPENIITPGHQYQRIIDLVR